MTWWQGKVARLPVIILVGLGVSAGSKPAPPGSPAPRTKSEPLPARPVPSAVHEIRVLAALQDQIALGSHEALSKQTAVMRDLRDRLASEANWKDRRNREAIIKFTLSGGSPDLLADLIANRQIPDAELALAKGVLEYARGHGQQAAESLRGIDPRQLPPSLAGHVSLVLALLSSERRPEQALAFCDEARLLSPGTLVEEAALRLTIELSVRTGDADRFEASVMRHLYRFPDSPYAPRVDARIARVVAARKAGQLSWRWLTPEVISEPSAGRRRSMLVSNIAEMALRSGNLETAAAAARIARATAPPGSTLATTSRAIEGAATVLQKDRAPAVELLAESAAARPSEEISQLISAARALGDSVSAALTDRHKPSAGSTRGNGVGGTKPAIVPDHGSDAAGKLALRARERLKEVDRFLMEMN